MIKFQKLSSGNVLVTYPTGAFTVISEPVSIEQVGNRINITRSDNPAIDFLFSDAADYAGVPLGNSVFDVALNLGTNFFSRGGGGGTAPSSVTADDVIDTDNKRVITQDEGKAINIHLLSEKSNSLADNDELKIWDSAPAPETSLLKKIKLSTLFNYILGLGVLRSSNNLSDVQSVSSARSNLGLTAAATATINDTGTPADGSFLVGNGTDMVQKTLSETKQILDIYPLTYYSSTASKTITDQNENSLFSATGAGSTTIQVTNTPVIVGSRAKIRISGLISTASNAGSSIIKIKFGGVTVITSSITLSSNLSNSPIDIDIPFTFRTVGASATVIGNGLSNIYNGANAILVRPLAMTSVSSGFSTNSAFAIDVTVQFANTGNSLTITNSAITIER